MTKGKPVNSEIEIEENGTELDSPDEELAEEEPEDPIEAVSVLGPYIKHVHIKDAIRTKQAGTWGAEVPWGEGEVGSEAFLGALERIGYKGALAIEREAGEDRFGDIKLAVERLGGF